MEAGPCLLTSLRAARPMTEVAGEVHPDAPTEAAVKTEAAVQIEVRGAGRNAKVSAAARCSHPRSRGCLSRPSPMT